MAPGFSLLQGAGYRRLKVVNLALAPLNVLIGANGVGKSSVLDVFELLAASAQGHLERAITESGGFASLLTADGDTQAMHFALLAEGDSVGTLSYQVKLATRGYGYVVAQEQLSPESNQAFRYIDGNATIVRYTDQGGPIVSGSDHSWLETGLSQAPRTLREADTFRRRLADISEIYHVLDISRRSAVRLPQALSPADTPGANGENLLACLYTMRETHPERFEAVIDALKAAFPTFQRLEFAPLHGGFLTLGWRETDLTRPIYANELSEGTLRFLWLATLLQSPGLPGVTLIDEPEVSLHPDMLRLLADLMREAAQRSQLVVATHSDRFVRFLSAEELVICDSDEHGGMLVRRPDRLELEGWLEDYTLDQLWAMGRLGGRA